MRKYGKIKEEKILQIGRIYEDYIITTTKFDYNIPKEIIEILYTMQSESGRLLYRNIAEQSVNIIKEKR